MDTEHAAPTELDSFLFLLSINIHAPTELKTMVQILL